MWLEKERRSSLVNIYVYNVNISIDLVKSIYIYILDSGKRIYVCIRRGIALVKEGSMTDGDENVDIKVTTTENTWKEIMAKVGINYIKILE